MVNFFHTWEPTAVVFSIGAITIHWYGLLIASSIVVVLLLARQLIKNTELSFDDISEALLYSVILGIIGARLYEVFIINWWYYQKDWSAMFRVWEGGLAIHGGIIFGVTTLYFWSKWRQKNFWQLADLAALLLPLAQSIGRWGNYFNQELFGRPTAGWWGIPISTKNRPEMFIDATHFQPLFLYESIFDLLLFIALYGVYRAVKLKPGQLSGLYLAGYGTIRFGMEYLRIDYTPDFWGLRFPQLVSLLLIGGGAILYFGHGKYRKNVLD